MLMGIACLIIADEVAKPMPSMRHKRELDNAEIKGLKVEEWDDISAL